MEATEPRKARAEVVKFYTNAKELNFPRKFFSQQRVGQDGGCGEFRNGALGIELAFLYNAARSHQDAR